LLATGKADQMALDLEASDPHTTLLSKPFAMKELKGHLDPLGKASDPYAGSSND